MHPFFPKSRAGRRVNESKVLIGSTMGSPMACAGWMHRLLMDPTTPSTTVAAAAVAHKGVFALLFSRLARSHGPETEEAVGMIDATDVKAHPTVFSFNKGACIPLDRWRQRGHDQQATRGL